MTALRTFGALVAALLLFTAPVVGQAPELPRTPEARPAMAIRAVDAAVKVNRDFYRGTPMAVMLASAMQGSSPIITVIGTGRLYFDVSAPTLADAQAQGYRVYVGTRTVGVNLNVTCAGTASPWSCSAAIADFRSQLTTTAQALAVTAFVPVEDGTSESPKALAPFTLRLAGPLVGPVYSPTPIRPQ